MHAEIEIIAKVDGVEVATQVQRYDLEANGQFAARPVVKLETKNGEVWNSTIE